MRNQRKQIGKEDIFENDKLNRKSQIELLSKIIENARGPYVLGLDAEWGSGKSFFIELLQSSISKDYETISINAWESDYSLDPMVTLISELQNVVSKKNFSSISHKFIKASKFFISPALKIATHGIIDVEKIAEGLAEVGEKFISKKIENYEEERESIDNLRNALCEYAEETKGDKIVVFIDELDRCKPTFAVEFLERIKHFFDLKGYIFIISTDKKQRIESIRGIYGNNFDSENYLRRFIDFSIRLQSNIGREIIVDTVEQVGLDKTIEKWNQYGIPDIITVIDFFEYLAIKSKLTARDVNQIISELNILLLSKYRQNNAYPFPLLISMIILRNRNSDLYHKFINKECSPDLVIEEFDLLNSLDRYDKNGYPSPINVEIVSKILGTILGGSQKSELINKFKSFSENDSNVDEIEKDYANQVLSNIRNQVRGSLDQIRKLLELDN